MFRRLKLTDAVGVEVESARLRVSGVWSKIMVTVSMSAAPLQARKDAADSGQSTQSNTS